MRIIKRGKIQNIVETEVLCKKCHTEYAHTNAEIKSDRDGQYTECPVCGAHNMAGSTLVQAYYNK